jgi:transcriptional regulator of arginine metabolism
MNSALKDAVLKIEAAKNIVVVKTLSGMANAVAVCVDSLKHDDIVGSVAGDDTILLVIKTDELAKEVEESLLKNFMLN